MPNNTILERGQLIAGVILTASGKLDVLARPYPVASRLVRRRRRPVRFARALRAAA